MIATVSYGCVYFALRAVVSFEQAPFLSIRPIFGSKTAAGYVVVFTVTSLLPFALSFTCLPMSKPLSHPFPRNKVGLK